MCVAGEGGEWSEELSVWAIAMAIPLFFFFKTTQDKRTRMSDGRYGKRSKTKRKCHFATITKKMSPHRKGGSSPSRLQMTVRIQFE